MSPRPKRQGAFDGACGFYAVHNAVSLICPKLVSDDDFSVLLQALSTDGFPRQFFQGTGRNQLNSMLTRLLADGRFEDVTIQRPFWTGAATLGGFWTAIEHHLNEPRTAAIVGFNHARAAGDDEYSHWSVVCGATSKTFTLHDSAADLSLRRILRRRSRVWDDKSHHSGRPYCFDTVATFLLRNH